MKSNTKYVSQFNSQASTDSSLWNILPEHSQAVIRGGITNDLTRGTGGDEVPGGIPDIVVRDDDDDS